MCDNCTDQWERFLFLTSFKYYSLYSNGVLGLFSYLSSSSFSVTYLSSGDGRTNSVRVRLLKICDWTKSPRWWYYRRLKARYLSTNNSTVYSGSFSDIFKRLRVFNDPSIFLIIFSKTLRTSFLSFQILNGISMKWRI